MGAWVGPAIVAAVISGFISLLGLYLGGWISIRHDHRRRVEKVRDFQIALRAEIRSELHNLSSTDFEKHFAEISARYRDRPDYSVRASHPARHVIFEAISAEIHLLPEMVIDPVIVYSRQRHAIEAFVADLRDRDFKQFPPERQLEMYRDLIDMQIYLRELAERSVLAIDQSIAKVAPISSRASGLSDPKSGRAP